MDAPSSPTPCPICGLYPHAEWRSGPGRATHAADSDWTATVRNGHCVYPAVGRPLTPRA